MDVSSKLRAAAASRALHQALTTPVAWNPLVLETWGGILGSSFSFLQNFLGYCDSEEAARSMIFARGPSSV